MKLLAIDCSTEIVSAALLINDEVISLSHKERASHAKVLLPMINSILLKANLAINNLDAIAYCSGPGSFTGVRIGISVAKGLAFAHDIPLIPVSSLQAIALGAHLQLNKKCILAAIDARMDQMYWGLYEIENNAVVELEIERVSNPCDILINSTESIVLAGVGVDAYFSKFSQNLIESIEQTIECFPDAKKVVKIAQHSPLRLSVDEAEPSYIRNNVIHRR